jgi:hypothetical protein
MDRSYELVLYSRRGAAYRVRSYTAGGDIAARSRLLCMP